MPGPPTGGKLGSKIAELAAEATARVRTAVAPAEQELRQRATLGMIEGLETEGSDLLGGWWQAALLDPDVPEATKQAIRDTFQPTKPIQIVAIAGMLIGAALGMAAAATAGFIQTITNWSLGQFGDLKLSPSEAAAAARMGLMSDTDAYGQAKASGVQRDLWPRFRELQRQLIPVGEILTGLNRGLITETQARDQLAKHGFNGNDQETLLALRLSFPTPADLVTMAVREVFTPEIAQRFGQYEGLPPQFLDLAGKVGMSREFATWYWAAHWNLPSATQGFEMLHRGVINESDLDLLLKALDIMPYWRDRLREISYNPLTRVDVRRAYRIGVLSEQDVYKSYLDIGYAPDNARTLTDFTVKEKLESERELTKSEIITLFEAGTFTREQAIPLLVDLEYTEAEANFILDLGQHRKERRRLNTRISLVRSRFVAYRIDETEATTALDALGVPTQERNDNIRDWLIERELSAPDIPISTMARFMKKGIIDIPTFVTYAGQRGYTEEQAVWYVFDVMPAGVTVTEEGEIGFE